jgi:hypothetical protein
MAPGKPASNRDELVASFDRHTPRSGPGASLAGASRRNLGYRLSGAVGRERGRSGDLSAASSPFEAPAVVGGKRAGGDDRPGVARRRGSTLMVGTTVVVGGYLVSVVMWASLLEMMPENKRPCRRIQMGGVRPTESARLATPPALLGSGMTHVVMAGVASRRH